MKQLKSLIVCSICITAFALQSFAQGILPEVTIKAIRYKYLSAVGDKEASQPVKVAQRQVAEYDVKKAEFYEDDYDGYFVSFYIPEGKILAAYDQDGKLLRTAEKFKNVMVPSVVRDAVAKRFPQWGITENVYLVNYNDGSGATKVYKLLLENGDKRLKVKTNEKGEFL